MLKFLILSFCVAASTASPLCGNPCQARTQCSNPCGGSGFGGYFNGLLGSSGGSPYLNTGLGSTYGGGAPLDTTLYSSGLSSTSFGSSFPGLFNPGLQTNSFSSGIPASSSFGSGLNYPTTSFGSGIPIGSSFGSGFSGYPSNSYSSGLPIGSSIDSSQFTSGIPSSSLNLGLSSYPSSGYGFSAGGYQSNPGTGFTGSNLYKKKK